MCLPQETKFKQMISQLPEEYRPALEAFITELNELQLKLNMQVKYNNQFLKRANILIEDMMQHAPPQTSSSPPDSQPPHAGRGIYGAGTQEAPGCVVDLYGRPSPKGTLYEGVI